MESENGNESSKNLRKDPEKVNFNDGDLLTSGKKSGLSSSSSSSSDASNSTIDDFLQVEANEQSKSDDPSNFPPVSEQSVQKPIGPTSPTEVSGFTPELILLSESPMQSPPVQLMGKSEDTDPYRIPAYVFERSKSTTPMEWSVASNESLFSIHVGNNSFSRDHVYLMGKSGELDKSELTKYDELMSYPMSPLPDSPLVEMGDLGVTEAAAETMKAVLKAAAEDLGKEYYPPADIARNSSRKSHHSDGSGTSTCSFAFPIKKKWSWPFCYCCNGKRAFSYCIWPFCYCSNGRRTFSYCTWPICYCSNGSCAFCYHSNCSRTSICSFSTLTGEGGKTGSAKGDHPEQQLSPRTPRPTANTSGKKWFSCFSCCPFCH